MVAEARAVRHRSAPSRERQCTTSLEEEIAQLRVLGAINPATYKPDLARSLNDQGIRLSEIGRRDEALTAIEEATTTYRTLADTNPAAYLPNLAMSLNNLASLLNDLGSGKKAVAAQSEADAITDRLVANP